MFRLPLVSIHLSIEFDRRLPLIIGKKEWKQSICSQWWTNNSWSWRSLMVVEGSGSGILWCPFNHCRQQCVICLCRCLCNFCNCLVHFSTTQVFLLVRKYIIGPSGPQWLIHLGTWMLLLAEISFASFLHPHDWTVLREIKSVWRQWSVDTDCKASPSVFSFTGNQ